jgi:hypothetical protein
MIGEPFHEPGNQLGLRPPREWQRPPGKLEIVVLDQGSRAYVQGDVVQGNVLVQVDEFADWRGDLPYLAGPIQSVCDYAEQFQARAQAYLNDIEPTDLAQRLEDFKPQPDWA